MTTINMLSKADMAKGHGVLSAFEEQTRLVTNGLSSEYHVKVNDRGSADILHIHTINPGFFLRALFCGSSTTVGYVHFLPETLEGSIKLPKLLKKIFYAYILAFYRSMDQLVVVNPSFIPMLEKYGIPKEKVTFIPNFVDDSQFHPQPDQKRELRKKFSLPEESFTVLCAGQMQKRKGFFDFLETARRHPEMSFVWAGGFSFGKLTDGYDEIRQAVKDLPPNVKLTGIIPREEMNSLYNAADVFFLPSFDELFPMTVLEAMSCGVPVLLRDLDLYPCILSGYYTKADTVDGFVTCLQALTKQEEWDKAARRSKTGHERYSKKTVLSLWQDYYASLVRSPLPLPGMSRVG